MLTTPSGTRRRLGATIGLFVALALVASATAGAYPVMPDGERLPGLEEPAPASSAGAFEPAIAVEDGSEWVRLAAVSLCVPAAAFVAVALSRRGRPAAT